MSPLHLHEISSRLDRAFETTANVDDDEVKSHLARYLCVLTSGYLETAIKTILRDYVYNRSTPYIHSYVIFSTNNLTNLKSEKISDQLSHFCSEWKEKFDTTLTDEEKSSVNSVVANRNQIAHGQNSDVTYVRIKEWYKNIKHVILKVEQIVNS